MLWFPVSLTSLPCTVKKLGERGHFSPAGINSASCHSNWPSNPRPVAKCLVWLGHFVQIKPERLKGDLLGILGRKIPCSLARAPRCVLSILFRKKWSALTTQEVFQPLCHNEGRCQAVLRQADWREEDWVLDDVGGAANHSNPEACSTSGHSGFVCQGISSYPLVWVFLEAILEQGFRVSGLFEKWFQATPAGECGSDTGEGSIVLFLK